MITLATLRTKTAKELGALAKEYGVAGASSLRKEDLIKQVLKAHKADQGRTRRKAKSASVEAKKVARAGTKKTVAAAAKGAKAPSVNDKGKDKSGRAMPATVSKSSGSKSQPVAAKSSSSPAKTVPKPPPVKAPVAKPGTSKTSAAKPVADKNSPVRSAKPAPVAPVPAAKSAEPGKSSARRSSSSALPRPRSRPTPEFGPSGNAPASQKLVHIGQAERDSLKDLSGKHRHELGERDSAREDRVVLLVRDAFWLQANWQITRHSVERAQAAMAEHWHTSRPVLRLFEVDGGATTGAAERPLRDVEIHGGVQNWYIDVAGSPRSLMAAIGYLGGNGKFHAITRSNRVTTPSPNSADVIDEHWSDIAENYEKIYAQSGGGVEAPASSSLQDVFEEHLRRPMGSSFASRYGINPEGDLPGSRDFNFEVDAEMVIFGKAPAESRVTMAGEPIKLREDGSFTVRVAMPDRRQVIPISAASADGFESRTIVLAIERNTKVMEPKLREDID